MNIENKSISMNSVVINMLHSGDLNFHQNAPHLFPQNFEFPCSNKCNTLIAIFLLLVDKENANM